MMKSLTLERGGTTGARTMDVQDLVIWVYRDQKAHLGAGSTGAFEARLGGGGVSMTAVVGNRSSLGCAIDGGGIGNGRLHPVAEAVDQHLSSARALRGGLVRRYGISGTLPEGYDLQVGYTPVWKISPEYGNDGLPKPRSFIMKYAHDQGAHRPIWCPIQPDHEERYVEERRAEFIDWLSALHELRAWCDQRSAQLRNWRITGPSLPLLGWVDADPKWRAMLRARTLQHSA